MELLGVIQMRFFIFSLIRQVLSLHALECHLFVVARVTILEATFRDHLTEDKEQEVLVDIELSSEYLNIFVRVRRLDLLPLEGRQSRLKFLQRVVRNRSFFSFDDDLFQVLPIVVLPKVVQIGNNIHDQDDWSKWYE